MKYYSKIGIFSGYNLQLLLISTTLYIWALRVFPAWWYGSCAVGVHALGLSPLWLFGKGEPPRSGIAGLGGVSWPPRCCVPRCPEQGVLRHHPERTQLSLAARLSSSALLFPALAVPDALTPLSTCIPASCHVTCWLGLSCPPRPPSAVTAHSCTPGFLKTDPCA